MLHLPRDSLQILGVGTQYGVLAHIIVRGKVPVLVEKTRLLPCLLPIFEIRHVLYFAQYL